MTTKKPAVVIDGKKTAAKIKEEIKSKVAELIDQHDRAPHLAAVIVGEHPASQTYVASKEKSAQAVGITSSIYRYPETMSEEELLDVVNFLNDDPEIDGFIVQLPLPSHMDVDKIISTIRPDKDVDGFHPMNIGKMAIGQKAFVSATPAGIMELLSRYGIETDGKHAVVLGRSNIVGTPVSILLSKKTNPGNATVTLCHSRTQNLAEITRMADILIAAIGQPNFVTADMVKEGAVVIDVGIHRIPANNEKGYRITGDVDFEAVALKASHITPVPGGVGPMTIAMLLKNTLDAHLSNY